MKLILLPLLLLTTSIFANIGLYEMGKAYYYGDGVEQDYDKAFSAFSYATKVGDSDAQTALAIMHIEGKGTPQNDKQGITLLQESANQDHAKAQYYLGSMYYLGIGVDRDLEVAFQWIKKSAEFSLNV